MKHTFINEFETRRQLSDFILRADKLSMGQQCKAFEQEFCKAFEHKHSVLVNSGASANLVVLQALINIGKLTKGDKIGFSSVTWSTNVMPILQLGLIPVPVDCDPTTLNIMNENLCETHKNNPLRALFVTNTLGLTGDLGQIATYCENQDIILLEDNCESLGSRLSGRYTGTFGLAATHSFFVAHHMSTIEGGMITTSDDELAEMLVITRANGWDRNLNAEQQRKLRSKHGITSEFEAKYTFYDSAFNVRPTEITGFLGLCQLEKLNESLLVRERNFIEIQKIAVNNNDFIRLAYEHMDFVSSFALPFVCTSPSIREHYIREFAGAGIEIRPLIAGNITRQPFYEKLVGKHHFLPGADILHNQAFYCGNYVELTEEDIETIKSCAGGL